MSRKTVIEPRDDSIYPEFSLPPPPHKHGYTCEEAKAMAEEDAEYDVEEEDEDYANLTDDAKRELDFMGLMNEREVCGFHVFREFWARHPSKHPNYFLQVESDSGDASFLEKLTSAQLSRTIRHAYPERAKLKLTSRAVVSLLHEHTTISVGWLELYKRCLAAPEEGRSVYINTIKAAASLLHLIHTQDYLYMIARQVKQDDQTKKLWEEIQVLQGKCIPVYEFCDKIFQITADKDRYSFVTERDVARILSSYTPAGRLFCPFFYEGEPDFRLAVKVEKDEEDQTLDCIARDIAKVVTEMDSTSSILQADVYTRRLMKLIRGPTYVELKDLVDDVIEIVDANALVKMTNEQETLVHYAHYLLASLLHHEKEKVKQQLLDVVQPLSMLNVRGPPYLSSEILEIVEVAELRRMALGSRFIGRSHLMWAFYECGYGLPKIRKIIDLNSPDNDHPPYHIYVTAMKLAVFYGVKKMRLEHFIFAVLFAQGKVFDGSEEPPTQMCQDFEDFMKDIALERSKVDSKSSKTLSSDLRDNEEINITNIEPKSLENASESRDTNENITMIEPELWNNSNADWRAFMDSLLGF